MNYEEHRPPPRLAPFIECIRVASNRVVFENPDHVFARRVLYWLGEDGSLQAKIEGTLGGKPASQQWSWRRSP